ncbi:MAG: ATP-dependent DNA helicase RecG [Microgenomates group bacterium]
MTLINDQSIEKLPHTSPSTIKKFKSLKIKTFFDLLNYFPFRYEDYSIISKINQLQPGEIVTITGKIIDKKYQITKKGLKMQIFKIEDDSGQIETVFYNQEYLLKLFQINQLVSFAGKVEVFGQKIIFSPLEYELGESMIHTGRIVPIYSEKKGLSSRIIREKIYNLLFNSHINLEIKEFLPKEIINYNQLIDEKRAYQQIHFPENKQQSKISRQRLGFDELFILQLSNLLIKKKWEKETVGNPFASNPQIIQRLNQFIACLPFQLTNDQKKVWQEIFADLQKQKPMNRLLQGDVGSGKTVVATIAAYFSFLNGYQTLIMAPTEILANQHYKTITGLFQNEKLIDKPKISLITSSTKKNKELENADIIIGTHALITNSRNYDKVGLVIIDEQHRFGVAQRAMLKQKGINPHLLTMTATPIPRTIALTIYGELDFSVINQMPKGRLPVKTFFVPKVKRQNCYQWIKNQIKNYHAQVFIVCPLIEESEVETMKSIKAAKKEYENLKKIFDQFRLGLLHGKLKAKEKEKIMNDFKNHQFDILVTTPVVEVGVDIPGATIILIEAAERFGLAQLHQLRGRVGRNDKQSYCFLFSENENENIINRLKLFSRINNGNKLAEEDLKIRGPGDIYGTKQHGFIDLKIASFSDYQLIEKTKKAVEYFNNHYQLEEYPELKNRLSFIDNKLVDKN